jgi:trehalose 2-sulfotransferase
MFTSYIICATPRTGSTLLCKLLASTQTAGNPNSFYHRVEFMREWAVEWGLPDCDPASAKDLDIAYLGATIRAGKAGTGTFGLRLQKEYLRLLSETLDRIFPGLPSDASRFERAFGRILYIHLTRADKVAQAVSLVRAQQSGLWHAAPDGTEIERLSAPQDPHYDFDKIGKEVCDLEAQEASWNDWFERQQITPMRVQYERLAADPAKALIDICKALGVEAPEAQSVRPAVARLSDELSLEWIRRYRADVASRSTGEDNAP